MFYLATIFILSIESLSATISEREEITSLKYYGENLQKPSKSLRRALIASERPDWLSDVPDDRKINSLSLPGTHETCAQYGGPACACQDLTLMEQLQAGVRIFDIRCRHVNDVFMIHHGIIYQHLSFGTGVRDVMIEFLKEHPREFIYMMVKEEYEPADNTQTFEQTMNDYITPEFFLEERSLTVGEVRGKIVMLRRFTSTIRPMGNELKFQDDATFTSSTTIVARVQDCYTVSTLFDRPRKWDNMNSLLTEARENTNVDLLFINYGSGASAFCYPYSTCEYINPLIGNYLQNSYPKAFTGCIMLDYINCHYDNLIQLIIQRNFDDDEKPK